MLRKGCARRPEPRRRAASRASGESRSSFSAKRASGPQGTTRRPEPRVQRVRALDVLLDEVLVVLPRARCRGRRRDDSPALDRVLAGLGQRDEVAVDLALRELEAGRPAHRLERRLAGALERLESVRSSRARRRAVEAADADVDRMDLAAADQPHKPLPVFFTRDRAPPVADASRASSTAPS